MALTTSQLSTLTKRASKVRADSMQRHVLVCKGSDCDKKKVVTKAIKHAVAQAGMRKQVTVSRVDCLDICKSGTIAIVYPEGTWYADVDARTAGRIAEQHLCRGRPLDDHVFLSNPLGG